MRPPTSLFCSATFPLKTASIIQCSMTLLMLMSSARAQYVTKENTSANNANSSAITSKSQASVTTTVVVRGHVDDEYLPWQLSVGSLDGLPILSSPVSATVVTRDLMTDQFSRVLADVVKNDASVGEDYAPVGYYGDFQIRGFVIDLATGLQINGLVISGEQDVPLENKERVEILKGIAGVESGITAAGGLIDFVTKRPTMIKTLDLATDHRGTAFGSLDVGRLLGAHKQIGLRTNLAGEEIRSYVQHADGWRGMGSGATDWKWSELAVLTSDFEYQHKRQRSEAGYQLLGGNLVPGLNSIYPSEMLGYQSYAKPNTFDAFNASSRLDLDIHPNWHTYMAASYSHSLIDDNVIYPYGAALDEAGNSLCPNSPYYFFCPDGSYEIYDYRSPGELRINSIGETIASGKLKTGSVIQNIVAGGSIFHRAVDLSPTIVYTQLGAENIFMPDVSYPIESPLQHSGPAVLADFNHQSSGILQDRIELPGHVRLTAGGRYTSVRDFNYTGSKALWLPQYSALWSVTSNLTIYGSHSIVLSLGPQAPFWVDNSSRYLAPFLTRQAEVGAKFEPVQRILLTASLYRMRAPFFYPRVIETADSFCSSSVSPGDLCFESKGRETHDGIEVGTQGRAFHWLKLTASAAAIEALSNETGTAAFNNKQVINVPRIKVTSFGDIALPQIGKVHLDNLHLLPGWSFSGRKAATRDDQVSVPSYSIFSLGARYAPHGEDGRVNIRIFADNILNKRYWKDTGASYGDTFIHLGAPATVRASAQYRF